MKFLLLWSVESNLIKIFNHPSNAFFATPPNPLSKAIITRPSLLDGQLEGGIRVGFGLSDGDKAMGRLRWAEEVTVMEEEEEMVVEQEREGKDRTMT